MAKGTRGGRKAGRNGPATAASAESQVKGSLVVAANQRSVKIARGGLSSPDDYLRLCDAMIQDILGEKLDLKTASVLARVCNNAVRFMDVSIKLSAAAPRRVA